MFREFPELKPPKGKFRIIGIEMFENPGEGHWIVEDMNDAQEAVKKATLMSKNASKDVNNPKEATIFCVYDENGTYLGGNIYSKS